MNLVVIFENEAEIFRLRFSSVSDLFSVLSDLSECVDFSDSTDVSGLSVLLLSAETLHRNLTVQLQDFSTDFIHSDFALQDNPVSQEFSLK